MKRAALRLLPCLNQRPKTTKHFSQSSYSTLSESSTYLQIFKALDQPQTLSDLHKVHSLVLTNGFSSKSVLACRLIVSYARLSGLATARKLFDSLPKRTVHAFNNMLKAYIDVGRFKTVLQMFSNMLYVDLVPPDPITLSIAIKSCVAMRELLYGKIVHFHVLVNGFHSDLHLVAGLIDLYSKCDRTDDARKLFDAVLVRDAFVWTAMIDGCLRSRDSEEALILFAEMRAAGVKATSVTWNTLMAGFARMGLVSDMLYMLHQMQLEGMHPENVCVCSILPAFSESAILKPGKEAHAYSIRMCFDSDLFVASALVDMYAKCGNLDSAIRLFAQVEVKDTGLWNSIIVGHAIHGRCADALGLFDSMCESGVKPNEITFTSVLSACSHAGEVDEGYRIFRSMVIEYGIVACHEHYACVVDLLARAGRLEEAHEIIRGMPARPMEDVWGAFLSACRTHSNSKLAMLMEEHIVSPENVSAEAGYHVVMLDIHAGNGRWRDVARLRTRIRDRGLKKKTGFSWIEIGDMVHIFHKADVSHPKSDQIYALLESLEAVNASVKASQMDSFLQREEAVLLC